MKTTELDDAMTKYVEATIQNIERFERERCGGKKMKITAECFGKKMTKEGWDSTYWFIPIGFSLLDPTYIIGEDTIGSLMKIHQSDDWLYYEEPKKEPVLMSPRICKGLGYFSLSNLDKDKPLKVVLKNQYFIGEDGIKRRGEDMYGELWIEVPQE